MRYRALTVHQPWAWLIAQGFKEIENRNWRTAYRGPLLIHAARVVHGEEETEVCAEIRRRFGIIVPEGKHLVRGAFIARVDLVDCVQAHRSPWFEGPYGFVLHNVQPLSTPIPARGQLSLFEVELELEQMPQA